MRIFPELQDSIESRFASLARSWNAEGKEIISLGLGEPNFPTPPTIIEAAAQAMRDGYTRYSNPLGLFELRKAICEKLKSDNGISSDPDRIVVTPGAKMALSLALAAVLRPGDEVINITPCYPSFIPQIRIAEPDATIHNVDLRRQDFSLDIDAIEQKFSPKTAAIILNFPHNPTGRMITRDEISALVRIVGQSKCYIISDEIYEQLNFSGVKHISPASCAELAARTITINGFAKSFSMTGWRIGYLALPDLELTRLVSKFQQHLNTNTATFVQKAACAALELDGSLLHDYNRDLAANAKSLQEMGSARPRLSLVPSQGGLFAFIDVGCLGLSSDQFAAQLLERHGVAVTPGFVFGRNWDDHVRVSLAIAPSKFSEGISRLDAMLTAAYDK